MKRKRMSLKVTKIRNKTNRNLRNQMIVKKKKKRNSDHRFSILGM